MNWRGWLKALGVAAVGGGMTGGLAALLDPQRFNFRDGVDEAHIAEMAVEGAAVSVGAFFMRSPLGRNLLELLRQQQEQMAADRETIKQFEQAKVFLPQGKQEP